MPCGLGRKVLLFTGFSESFRKIRFPGSPGSGIFAARCLSLVSLLLFEKIVSLFLILASGYVLVKLKVLRSADSRILSQLCLYLVVPIVIINAFSVEYTPEILKGFALSSAAALTVLLLNVLLGYVCRKTLKLDPVEECSVVYSNAGNLIIPIVASVLGPEWVLYTSPFICLQLIFIWTHGYQVITEQKGMDLKKVITNINVIAILIGILFFALQIKLPYVIRETFDSIGSLLGPVSMLVTGMLIGGMDLKKVFLSKRVWLTAFLRLIVFPLLPLLVLKYCGLQTLHPGGANILLISFFACISPSAAMITQMAQVYGKDAEHASAVNVLTTLLCIATMPLLVMLYQL